MAKNLLHSKSGKAAAWVAILAVVIVLFLSFFFIIKASGDAEPEADRVITPAIEATE